MGGTGCFPGPTPPPPPCSIPGPCPCNPSSLARGRGKVAPTTGGQIRWSRGFQGVSICPRWPRWPLTREPGPPAHQSGLPVLSLGENILSFSNLHWFILHRMSSEISGSEEEDQPIFQPLTRDSLAQIQARIDAERAKKKELARKRAEGEVSLSTFTFIRPDWNKQTKLWDF